MNNTKLINTLAAVSLTILILVVAIGFGWRQGDETAAELDGTGTVGSAASAEAGGDAFAAPADLMAKQALEAQLTQMNATIEVMQAREAEFQAQIETANGLLANSGGGTDPAVTQQMADLQANLAIMQQREAEYRAQLELANQRLQAQATAVTQAQSAAPAASFNEHDDDDDDRDDDYDDDEHEDDDHDDDHDDDDHDDDDEDDDDD
jgi:hypothetical protein